MLGDTYLYLIRHGATAANEGGVLQGRGVDNPLSERGELQAKQTARALADRPLAAIYCSPLQRAQQTAAAIGQPHDFQPSVIEGVAEVHVGRWEGRTWQQIQADEPTTYEEFMNTDGEVGYPDGESFTPVYDRVCAALEPLYEQHAGQSFAVVAHSVVNRCYLATVLGREPHRGRDILQQNCGVNIIRRRNGKLRIATLNGALHLD